MTLIKIANIYNNIEDVEIDIFWDEDNKEIVYHTVDTDEWNVGETADTIDEAIDDTYDRYRYGWELEINEIF